MLLGQRLGRRHQRRLVAGLERAQHRVDGDHGLARAHLAHQQPLHRPARPRGRRRSRRRPRAGRPVGSNGSEPSQRRDQLARRRRCAIPGATRAGRRGASPAPPGAGRAPRTRAGRGPRVACSASREVRAAQRVAPRRRGRAGRAARRAAARSRRRRARPPARSTRAGAWSAQLARRVVDGDDPGRVDAGRPTAAARRRRSRGSRPGSRERSSLPLSSRRVPGPQALGEVGLVEPDRLHRPARVGDRRPRPGAGCAGGSAAPAPSAPSTITVASSPIAQVGDLADPGAVAVAVGHVPEQVAERLDPDRRRRRGELRARRPSATRSAPRGGSAGAASAARRRAASRGPALAGADRARNLHFASRLDSGSDGTDRRSARRARARAAAAVRRAARASSSSSTSSTSAAGTPTSPATCRWTAPRSW